MASEGHSDECPIACFFKLILEPRLDLQKLQIPKKFMTTHGNDLHDVVYLKIPSGKVWEMELVRENGNAFLQKGWPIFVEFYSLCHRHFLMFKYEGNSRFNVIICSMSASEIAYPQHPQSSKESPPKKRKTTDSFANYLDLSEKAKGVSTIVGNKGLVIFGRHNSLTAEERKLVQAYAHQLKHPSFAIGIQPSAVKNKFLVAIPREFGRRYLEKKPFACTFNFRTNDKTTNCWPVTVFSSNARVKLSKGWKNFALDNRIKVGDICIFELIKKNGFKVVIIRDADAGNI